MLFHRTRAFSGIQQIEIQSKKVDIGEPFSPTRRGDILAARNGIVWMSDNTCGLTKVESANKQVCQL
jgi:hypothetical protein